MATKISLFDYNLPKTFIAQHPVESRDHSKLMVVERAPGAAPSYEEGVGGSRMAHRHLHFYDLPDLLHTGDVLVFNTSKVFKARLVEGGVELFLLKIRDGEVEALLKPGRKFKEGARLSMFGHEFFIANELQQGIRLLKTDMSAPEIMAFSDQHGQVPIPPYIKPSLPLLNKEGLGEVVTLEQYQTVYAKEVGSVAAPTAGFHFTTQLLDKIIAKGVQIEYVVLHVGLGTFRPVRVETLEEHLMHGEWACLEADVAARINDAKHEGRRIIAVGTTTTRVLEGVATMHDGVLAAYTGDLNLFITPGYQFKIIDGLITNFHLPKSTLLVLVSSFAGRENILDTYEEAKKNNYRFFSFGDAMIIL